jgi:sterol desaturase/sphingolipid hydroxylase (fatty acid hydroxylase superfamily)
MFANHLQVSPSALNHGLVFETSTLGMNTLQEEIIVLLSTPLYIIVIGIELLLGRLDGIKSYSAKDTFNNFCLSLLTGLVSLGMRGVSLIILVFFFQFRVLTIPYSPLYWIALLLFVDFMHYWLHRLGHSSRFFWAVHVNHHSSTHFNFTVGFRSGVLEPFYSFLFFIPIACAGFRPIDIFLMYSICEIWAILTHTEKVKKLGWLEFILVTPSHHRVHHASNPRYLDKNMGTVFILWDKLFGTFQPELPPEQYEPIRYGITSPVDKETVPHIIFHEWKNIRQDISRKDISWKHKVMYLFGPPGWSHDGSRKTSEQLRRSEACNR